MTALADALTALVDERRDLSEQEAAAALDDIMSGDATPAQTAALLTALRLKGETVERRVEVRVALDFLAMNPGEEKSAERAPRKAAPPQFEVTVPSDVVVTVDDDDDEAPVAAEEPRDIGRAPAYLPFNHIPETRQRIVLYRKLAQLSNAAQTDMISRISTFVLRTTKAPRRGIVCTKPSCSRREMASRTGVRLTPRFSARPRSSSLGGSSPA